MKLVEVREKLGKFNLPAFTLQDVIGIFQIQKTHASHLMARLVEAGSFVKIKRGVWAWKDNDPLVLTTYLTAPYPCYVSLQSALFYHGVIEQIPAYYYVISLGRSQKTTTPFGTFSIHHLNASLFTGFETYHHPFYQMATPEKALLDYFFMSKIEPKLFGKLPEIDLSLLNRKKLQNFIPLIKHVGTRTYLQEKLNQL